MLSERWLSSAQKACLSLCTSTWNPRNAPWILLFTVHTQPGRWSRPAAKLMNLANRIANYLIICEILWGIIGGKTDLSSLLSADTLTEMCRSECYSRSSQKVSKAIWASSGWTNLSVSSWNHMLQGRLTKIGGLIWHHMIFSTKTNEHPVDLEPPIEAESSGATWRPASILFRSTGTGLSNNLFKPGHEQTPGWFHARMLMHGRFCFDVFLCP